MRYRVKFSYKLYFPLIFLSILMGIFAFKMQNISTLVDREIKHVSKEEFSLTNEVEFIKTTLLNDKALIVKNVVNKKYEKIVTSKLDKNFLEVMKVLEKIKKSPYFQTAEKKEIIKRLDARIKGFYAVLKEMPEDFQESYDDGIFALMALSAINKKLSIELIHLQNITKGILDRQVFHIVVNEVEKYILILALSLGVSFLISYWMDKQIVKTLNKLKSVNQAFLLFIQKKSSDVKLISDDEIPNDELGDIIRYVNKIVTVDKKLKQEIEDTQKEIIFTMGAIGESRSKETGNHVKRVAGYSYLLAKLYGMSEEEASLIKEASPMHDIGKVAIPDNILKKPGKLTEKEFKIMKTHAKLGYEMLKHSQRPILKAASIIAYEHHEKYNGTGYPRGLKGEEIHIYGAITAVADVFDALGSDRVYKKAWDDEKIINLFIEETGEHFHPVLANLFLANFDEFVKIREKFKDSYSPFKEKAVEIAA